MHTWIDRNLKRKGRGSVAGLALHLGVGQDIISKMRREDGGRRPKAEELPLIEEFFGEPFPSKARKVRSTFRQSSAMSVTEHTQAARVVGEIGGGAWYEGSFSDFQSPDLPPDFDKYEPVSVRDKLYPALVHFALKVVGPSVDKIVRDGDFAICVPYFEAREAMRDNDVVAVERTKAGLHQGTIKRLRRVGKTWELHPESTDERFKTPIRLSDSGDRDRDDESVEVRIVGLVVGQYGDVS